MALQLAIDAGAILGSVTTITNAISAAFSRGMVIVLTNRSTAPLVFDAAATYHDHGEFVEPPYPTVPPNYASIFGVKGLLNAQGGTTYYGSGLDLVLKIQWEVPVFGENTFTGYFDGGARLYYDRALSVDGGSAAHARFEMWDFPTEGGWRRCTKCSCLVRQDSGADSACIAGGVHYLAGERNYNVLYNVPDAHWRLCKKCSCLAFATLGFPLSGLCHQGGIHEAVAGGRLYRLVELASAPGEAGWKRCALCDTAVLDPAGQCPLGGAAGHGVVPPLEFHLRYS